MEVYIETAVPKCEYKAFVRSLINATITPCINSYYTQKVTSLSHPYSQTSNYEMAASVGTSAGNGVTQTPTNRNRRGSSNVLFSGLINQKRGSVDEAAQARRASFNNMTPTPGFFGRMWNNYTMGTNSK